MVSTTSFVNSGVYRLFGTPFGIVKHPTCLQYIILSNKWGAFQNAGALFYAKILENYQIRIKPARLLENAQRQNFRIVFMCRPEFGGKFFEFCGGNQ